MQPISYRSGFVPVVGQPNVGKSTILNAMMEQKIAITAPKPQTTRRNQLGIYTTDHYQIIFVDTPGINEPYHVLDQQMYRSATESLADGDVILWVVDGSRAPSPRERHIGELLHQKAFRTPTLLLLNKSDLWRGTCPHESAYQSLAPHAQPYYLAALPNPVLTNLIDRIVDHLPPGPQYYPPEQVTTTTLRELAAELVREAALHALSAEVPHGIHVEVDRFDESRPVTHVMATVHVEKNSHKAIVIGRGGLMLKAIGTRARQELEAQLEGKPVFLDLQVVVTPDWRNSPAWLKRMGFEED